LCLIYIRVEQKLAVVPRVDQQLTVGLSQHQPAGKAQVKTWRMEGTCLGLLMLLLLLLMLLDKLWLLAAAATSQDARRMHAKSGTKGAS
jgi:hypothetical protein